MKQMSARVVSLQLHTAHGVLPTPVREVTADVGAGIAGDSHGGRPNRAVLVIDRSTHDALGLRPGDLREQITIDGLPDVTALPEGAELRIGGGTPPGNGEGEACTPIGGMKEQAGVEAVPLGPLRRRRAVCAV